MKVAVSCNDERVSPVFDWARNVLLVDRDSAGNETRHQRTLSDVPPAHRPGELAQLGVEVLLCGGISTIVAKGLTSKGIQVVAGLAGNVDEVLQAFFTGRLPDPNFSMPGWHYMPSEDDETGRTERTGHRVRARDRGHNHGDEE